MAGKGENDREPWSPRIDSTPLFINSADYERSLGDGSSPQDIDIAVEEAEDIGETGSAADPDPIGKPVG